MQQDSESPAAATPAAPEDGRITDYERAVCYYTLPRVVHPMTYGLVLAYTVCLLEAVGVLVYGLAWENPAFTRGGAIAIFLIILFGLVVFMFRALMNEVREKRALKDAQGVPDAQADSADAPNPFAHHILLRRRTHEDSPNFHCGEVSGDRSYDVQCHRNTWEVSEPSTGRTYTVRVLQGAPSFSLEKGAPRRLVVLQGEQETARIERKRGLPTGWTEIRRLSDDRKLQVRQQGIYWRDHLIGRVYQLRGWYYLDMDAHLFDEGALAYFLTTAQ